MKVFIDAGTSESWIEAVKMSKNRIIQMDLWKMDVGMKNKSCKLIIDDLQGVNLEISKLSTLKCDHRKDVTIRDCLIGKGAHIKQGANLTNVIVDQRYCSQDHTEWWKDTMPIELNNY